MTRFFLVSLQMSSDASDAYEEAEDSQSPAVGETKCVLNVIFLLTQERGLMGNMGPSLTLFAAALVVVRPLQRQTENNVFLWFLS